jgi:hypothetical protein
MSSVPALRGYLESLGDERAMDTAMWLDASASPRHSEEIDIDLESAL